MKDQEGQTAKFSSRSVSPSLRKQLQTISNQCINCKLCQKECAFLRAHGKPKHIADSYDPTNEMFRRMAFECSLCQLCGAVCPVNINPDELFLEMRREAVRTGKGDYGQHAGILGYEKRGTSKRYSFYAVPQECDTVFFPGCTLPGTRPYGTWALFEYLRKHIPTLGVVLDCCTKPSHDLGRDDYFRAMFGEMKDYLVEKGVRNVLVACPNCYKIFSKYGDPLSVQTVYEFLSRDGLPTDKQLRETVTVHDPCGVRYDNGIHSAVRRLCKRQGLSVQEMKHHKKTTLCCGEGGSVGHLTPDYAKNWGSLRKGETNGNRIITYCAGCAHFLGGITPTSHIVDLLFQPEAAMAGKTKVSRPPFTYLNRLKLKKRFRDNINAAVTRERIFSAEGNGREKGQRVGRLLQAALVCTIILAAYLILGR
jgi:Fe-S oxidoreductase